MGWLIAWFAFALFIGIGCEGVSSPIFYGFFVSTVVVGLARIVYGLISGVLKGIFGEK